MDFTHLLSLAAVGLQIYGSLATRQCACPLADHG